MDVLVLNTDFETIGIIDYYVSLIWTERYAEAGDFELYLRGDSSVFDIVQQGYYLYLKGAKMTMVIEQIEINTDVEEGNEMIITGRSLESLLDRRIIFPQTNLDGKLQNGVKKLLTENVISPTDSDRKIDNFVFNTSEDTAVTDLKLEAQYTGDNLYDTICAICASNSLGFRITLTEDNQFQFSLYSGTDRSYDQEDNTFVVFSAKYDNLISSNYLESNKSLKTVTVVAGEGEGTDRKSTTVSCTAGAGAGLYRRELFTDARDLSTTTNSEETMSEEAYYAKLEQRGLEKLAENVSITTFEGEVENGQTFTFDTDYHMGDIVQLVDQYGREGTVRVTELVRSISTSGIQIYPTFVSTFKATINFVGNPGDTIKISGTGFGYSVTLDSTGSSSVVVTATGTYTFTGNLTGVEKEVDVSTYILSYSIDLSFSATVVITTNASAAVSITSQTDTSVVYSGNADANGKLSFDVYRIGLYDMFSNYTPEEDDRTVELTEDPESHDVVNPDFKGNTYNVNMVYIYNISSITTSNISDSSNDIYLCWTNPDKLYSGMEIYMSNDDYPEERNSDTYTLVADTYGELTSVSRYDDTKKLAVKVTGLKNDVTYYYTAWPYITVGGTKYYGGSIQTSKTFKSSTSSSSSST